MKIMTWKEFKEEIDKQMSNRNISENTEIEYIDISHPCKDHPMCKVELYYDPNYDSIAIG